MLGVAAIFGGAVGAHAQGLASVAGAVSNTGFAPNAAGQPAAGSILHLIIGLNGVKRAERDAFLKSQYTPGSPDYHKWITADEYGRRFGASDSDVQAVVAYARSNGLSVTKVWPNKSFVSVEAAVPQAEAAFKVHIQGFNRPAHLVALGEPATFFAPDRAPQVAASVASKISFVGGLSNLGQTHPHSRQAPVAVSDPVPNVLQNAVIGQSPATAFSGPVSPSELSQIYNIDYIHSLGASGDGMRIAIYSPTLRYASDVTTFASYYGISGFTINDINIDGGATAYVSPGEAALDGEVIIGQAPHATVNYYSCPNDISKALDAFNQMAVDYPHVVSSSWSIGEATLQTYGLQWYATSFDDITAQMANEGITYFNDSGDWGAYDPNTSAITVQSEPASPNVVGVGGTSLPSTNGGYWNAEDPWSYSGGLGSGGGVSILRAQPWWQTGPGVSNAFSTGFRQVPDVAALGFSPYYRIYASGGWAGYYGTSASTPLWASTVLLYNQLIGGRMGNLNPSLYFLGANEPFPYHDIFGGSNGVQSGTAGWDYITGWGSADFGRLFIDLTQGAALRHFDSTDTGSTIWNGAIHLELPGSQSEPVSLDDQTNYEIGLAASNYDYVHLDAADSPPVHCKLLIDSTPYYWTTPAMSINNYNYILNAVTTKFTAGTHTLTFIVNYDKAIKDISAFDDTYTRTINVTHVLTPAITSVTPNPVVYGSANVSATINGTDFAAGDTVLINGASVTPTSITATKIVVPVANALFQSSKPISVQVKTGTFSSNIAYINIKSCPTTATLSTVPAVPVAGKPVTLIATITDPSGNVVPTGTVTFSKSGTTIGSATLVAPASGYGSIATISYSGLPTGLSQITVAYSGDSVFAANSTVLPITATAALASQTTISVSPASAVATQGLVFTVGVTGAGAAPTGSITLYPAGQAAVTAPLVNGVAYVGKTLGVGTNSVYAKYLGDGTYLPSNSPTISVVVSKMNTTTAITSSAPSSTFGQAVTLTALVKPVAPAAGPVTGSIQFLDGATVLGTVVVDSSGYAKITKSNFTVASHTITAKYLGTSNANVSSGQVTQTVTQAKPTIALTGSNIVLYKQSNTITVTLTGAAGSIPTGTATFMDGAATYATKTLANGVATINTNTLTVGAHSFKVVYSGDANYKTVTSTNLSVSVKDNTTVTILAASPTTASAGAPVTLTATVNPTTAGFGAATGIVKFREGATDLATATLVNGVATYTTSSLSTGSHNLVALYGGDAKYKTSTSAAIVVKITP